LIYLCFGLKIFSIEVGVGTIRVGVGVAEARVKLELFSNCANFC
jgi:hypothetical protein